MISIAEIFQAVMVYEFVSNIYIYKIKFTLFQLPWNCNYAKKVLVEIQTLCFINKPQLTSIYC